MIKIPANPQATLKRRIRQFYDLLNRRDFSRCHHMIDPRIRGNPRSVTRFQYESSVGEFLAQAGSIKILDIRVEPHLNEPSALYEGRDFAVGQTRWTDDAGNEHEFLERWVREGRVWYTRSTGFVAMAAPARK